MLLSLVIVAVEITSFTVACFSLVALLCFFSSIKKTTKKTTKKNKLWTKKGTQSVYGPQTFNCTRGGSPRPPFLRFLTRHRSGGSRGVCRFVKRRNQVFAQFVRPLLSGTAASKIRKVLFLEIVLVEKKNNNLVPYVINIFPLLVVPTSPPLPLIPPSFQPVFPSLFPPFLHPSPSTPQVLLESALKHWSRVKRYVAQDGSG